MPDGEGAVRYSETVEVEGLTVPLSHGIVTPAIEKPLRAGRYEAGEIRHLVKLLRPDDRVLDLGAGLGLVAAAAAKRVPEGRVVAVEANPRLVPAIRETWALNDVTNAQLVHGVVTARDDTSQTLYDRKDFWAASVEAESRPVMGTFDVPGVPLSRLLSDLAPTVISCDIEGAELGVLDAVELTGVRCIVMETHPKVYGDDGRRRLLAALSRQGFREVLQKRPSQVVVLSREIEGPPPAPAAPRTTIVTCMKNEGPFILEWVAWHRAIGVTDIVVFSNHCSDGSDRLLDRLDELGLVTHLPNPAIVAGMRAYQPVALKYAADLRAVREADYVISMDVDEFINVRTGHGRLADLFAAVPAFDALSMCELNHGANGRTGFREGWVTEQFPGHITETPGVRRARVGVKTIVRQSPRVASVRNHRPDLAEEVKGPVWLDGSGQPLPDLLSDATTNGTDCRGRRDLVVLDHFPLRSLESFLIKRMRGDVVTKNRAVNEGYWKVRNRNEAETSDLSRGRDLARVEYDRMAEDETLMELHADCVAAHHRLAESIPEQPDLVALREWIFANAWEGR